nr:leucine-rich repeat protein [Bacteroides intestinalis]
MKTTLYRHLSAAVLCLSAMLLIASCDKDKDNNNSSTNVNALPLNNITTRGATGSDFTDGQQLTAKLTCGNITKTTTLTYSSAENEWNSVDDLYWQSSTTEHTLLIYSAKNATIILPTTPSTTASEANYYLKEDRLYYRSTVTAPNIPASILLEHALAKLTVKLQPGSDMTADELTSISVKVSGVYTQGTVNTTAGDENEGKAGNGSTSNTITLCQPNTATQEYCTLLIPEQALTPAITVNMNGTDYTYTATQKITTAAGQNHTYILSLNRTGITGISATVEEWSGSNDAATEIQMNEITIDNSSEGGLENLLKNQGIDNDSWKYNKVIITGTLNDADYTTLKTYVNSGKIRGIKFPAGEEIPNDAFKGCNNLINADLTGVVTIGDFAFSESGLTSVTLSEGLTRIGDSAFFRNKSLTNITVPASVKTWGEWLFSESGLISVTLSEGLEAIGEVAFSDCKSLMSVTIPASVRTWGNQAFSGSGLTSVTLSEGLEAIGEVAFSNCKSLTNITIPASVKTLGSQAFSGSGLTSVTLSEGLTTIGEFVFSDCKSLTNITIPASVKTLGSQAFSGSGLTSVTLSEGLEAIGDIAFWSCPLEKVALSGDKSISVYNNAFDNTPATKFLFLYHSTMSSEEAITNWKTWGSTTWSKIYYSYKGSDNDKLEPGSYNSSYQQQ